MDNMYDAPELVARYQQGRFPDIDPRVQPGQPFSDRFKFIGDYLILKLPRFRAVLDAGCANGILGAILRENRPDLRYTGLDASDPLLAAGRAQFGDLRLVRGRIEQLPVKDNSAQAVVCGGTLWYCPDPPAALEALYRAASRVLLADIVFLPDRDRGFASTQVIDGHTQSVSLMGNKQMQALLAHLHGIQPFKDLREGKRFMHYPINPQAAGLNELNGELVQGFCVLFEKRISASFTKIFNTLAAERPAEEDETQR